MTDKHELIALAERVEALTGPCRETDAIVAAAVRYFPKSVGFVWKDGLKANSPEIGRVECCTSLGTGGPHYAAPSFTASLDAAMTLMPEGWKLRQMNFSGPCADDRKWHLNLRGGSVGQDRFVGRGRTLALVLTAAALRALAERERQQ